MKKSKKRMLVASVLMGIATAAAFIVMSFYILDDAFNQLFHRPNSNDTQIIVSLILLLGLVLAFVLLMVRFRIKGAGDDDIIISIVAYIASSVLSVPLIVLAIGTLVNWFGSKPSKEQIAHHTQMLTSINQSMIPSASPSPALRMMPRRRSISAR
ncbi:MAG: hypothetical protein C6W59_15625 [Paenibacillaceae bacterium]|nr:MAG: hypothetical protein C6W59_15625 [Paenibacillaceae bacterium]